MLKCNVIVKHTQLGIIIACISIYIYTYVFNHTYTEHWTLSYHVRANTQVQDPIYCTLYHLKKTPSFFFIYAYLCIYIYI